MDRVALDSFDKETLVRLIFSQSEAVEGLTKEVEVLRAENAKLRGKLDLPLKTPNNSTAVRSRRRPARSAPGFPEPSGNPTRRVCGLARRLIMTTAPSSPPARCGPRKWSNRARSYPPHPRLKASRHRAVAET